MVTNRDVQKAVLGIENWAQAVRRHWVNNLDLLRQAGGSDGLKVEEFVVSVTQRVLLVERVANRKNARIVRNSAIPTDRSSASTSEEPTA